MEYIQTTVFDFDKDTFKIDKPIRLVELFAGYGSQNLGMKYLGLDYESWKISEWAINSIKAYKDLHYYKQTYANEIDVDQAREWLKGRISRDYSNPLANEKIEKMKDAEIKDIYGDMMITHNLGSICSITGTDLEIKDLEAYIYIVTYSFPCQDLSLAGLGKGMNKGSGTRSGLLWEVERILKELKELGTMPQILLMENVPQVHGTKNKQDWESWLKSLEEMGYSNYWQDLNAKDYGVPQNRERTFMISIYGDWFYKFPPKKKLELRLKDVLDDEVEEKYYLSEKALNGVMTTNFESAKLENRTENGGIMPTLLARDYKDPKLVKEYE